MNDSLDEKKRFASLMVNLSDYYKQEISKGVMALYFDALRPYEFEDIERAAKAHILNPDISGSFMPKVSEFIKMMQGSTGDQSAVAWSKVDGAVRRIGGYQDVVFDDPIIHRVITDLGGWLWLNDQKDDAWPFIGNDFKVRYKAFRMRGETPEYARILIGTANAHNDGSKPEFRFLPVLIGDKEKAEFVMNGGSKTPQIQMRHIGDIAKKTIENKG